MRDGTKRREASAWKAPRLRSGHGAGAGDGGVLGQRATPATSLDDISAATGMNRPSLYAAFGDKQAIYLKAIERYRAGPALRDALRSAAHCARLCSRAYRAALAVYLAGDRGQRGCFVIGTAATEAVTNPWCGQKSLAVLTRGRRSATRIAFGRRRRRESCLRTQIRRRLRRSHRLFSTALLSALALGRSGARWKRSRTRVSSWSAGPDTRLNRARPRRP